MKPGKEAEIYGKMLVALEKIEQCKELAAIIPEVRTNLVYAKPDLETPEDVAAIDGRITVINGMPVAAGRPRFGASSYMARFIIELNKYDSSIRAGVNFANDPKLAAWLKDYCKSKGWVFSMIDRGHEPEEIKEEEGTSMPWKVGEVVRAAGGKVPKICYVNRITNDTN